MNTVLFGVIIGVSAILAIFVIQKVIDNPNS
jgi:hypothetical protein